MPHYRRGSHFYACLTWIALTSAVVSFFCWMRACKWRYSEPYRITIWHDRQETVNSLKTGFVKWGLYVTQRCLVCVGVPMVYTRGRLSVVWIRSWDVVPAGRRLSTCVYKDCRDTCEYLLLCLHAFLHTLQLTAEGCLIIQPTGHYSQDLVFRVPHDGKALKIPLN